MRSSRPDRRKLLSFTLLELQVATILLAMVVGSLSASYHIHLLNMAHLEALGRTEGALLPALEEGEGILTIVTFIEPGAIPPRPEEVSLPGAHRLQATLLPGVE